MRKISVALIVVFFCVGSVAYAEEQTGAAGSGQAQEAPAAASAAPAEKHPAAAGPAATEQKAGVAAAAHAEQPPHADPAYMMKLAAAVRAHVPANASVGAGNASCRFLVTASGVTSGIACKGSSPAHSQLLQKAIAATKAPLPPGGSFSAYQSVVFH
ncbi:MAG: hypothetical protein WAK01_16465 [Methylocystis sp.]